MKNFTLKKILPFYSIPCLFTLLDIKIRAGLLSSSKLRLIIKLWSLSCLGVLGYHSNRIGWSVDSLWISEGCKRKEPSYDCDLSSCQESREPEDLPLLVWECLSSYILAADGNNCIAHLFLLLFWERPVNLSCFQLSSLFPCIPFASAS